MIAPAQLGALAIFFCVPQLCAPVEISSAPSSKGERNWYALVIGNDLYRSNPLATAVRDATAMAARLEELGFTVTLVTNADAARLRKAVHNYVQDLRAPAVNLLFYAGHGTQVAGDLYMWPIDRATTSSSGGLSLWKVHNAMSVLPDAVHIFIADTCREENSRITMPERVKLERPENSVFFYSTAPGGVAADGPKSDGHTPFAHSLLARLPSGEPLSRLFDGVRDDVMKATNKAQVPWTSSTLSGLLNAFSLNPGVRVPPQQAGKASAAHSTDRFCVLPDGILRMGCLGDFAECRNTFETTRFVKVQGIEMLCSPSRVADVEALPDHVRNAIRWESADSLAVFAEPREADHFCAALGGRLPTPEELAYARTVTGELLPPVSRWTTTNGPSVRDEFQLASAGTSRGAVNSAGVAMCVRLTRQAHTSTQRK